MEIRLGRPIVPHRDIVESNESDFDSESASKSTDLLIKPKEESPFENYEEKREILEVLRRRYLIVVVKMISLLRWIRMIEKEADNRKL